MAIRSILHYPDKRLRVPGQPVDRVTPELSALIEDMKETMYAAPGCGLAAPQIGVSLRLFVIDTAADDEPSQLRVFITPRSCRGAARSFGKKAASGFRASTRRSNAPARLL